MTVWRWVEVAVGDHAPLGRPVHSSRNTFATRDEALAYRQRFLNSRMPEGNAGELGGYWVLGRDSDEARLFVSDSAGLTRVAVVRIEPPDEGGAPPPGRAARTGGRTSGRISPRELPIPLRVEGVAIGVCYAISALFVVGGFKSWLDPARWQMGRILFLPAIAVLVGSYYWGKNFRQRAFAHLRR